MSCQPAALLFRQQAFRRAVGGKASVSGSQHQQVPCGSVAQIRQVADMYLVQTCRNGSNPVLRQQKAVQAAEILRRPGGLTENQPGLLQRLPNDFIQLNQFLGSLTLTGCQAPVRLLFQPLPQLHFLQKHVESHNHPARVLCRPQPPAQMDQRGKRTLSAGVQLRQIHPILIGPQLSKPSGVQLPGCFPLTAAQIPTVSIKIQPVALFLFQHGQSGFQIQRSVLVVQRSCSRVQGIEYGTDDRSGQQIRLPGKVHRQARIGTCGAQRRFIQAQVGACHRYLPAARPFGQQFPDGLYRLPALLLHGTAGPQSHSL